MKKVLKKFVSISDTLIEWWGKILSWSVIIIMVLMIFEVIMRYVFNAPTHWSNALCLYLFGASGVLVGGWILKRDKNIRVDLIYVSFPPRVKAVADMLTCCYVIFWGYLITKFGWVKVVNAVVRHETSFTSWEIPMCPIRLCIPVAGVVLILAAVTKLIRDSYTLVTGGEL